PISAPRPQRNERSHDRVGHAAAKFAWRCGHLREEIPVEGAEALADDEDEDQHDGHERDEHRNHAQARHDHRHDAPPRVPPGHAADSWAGTAADARVFGRRSRVMFQIKSREAKLTMSVMTKRTRPT